MQVGEVRQAGICSKVGRRGRRMCTCECVCTCVHVCVCARARGYYEGSAMITPSPLIT